MSKKMLYIDKRFHPCPFCGAIPKIYWDDEQNVKNRTPQSVCFLVVQHSRRCFFTKRINNRNPNMIVSSRNFKKLLEEWNGKIIWEYTR